MKTLIRTACLLIVSCLALSQSVSAEDKKIGILVFDGVLTSDITAPLEVFGVASRQSWFSDYTPVVIAVKDTDSITTEEGLMLKTDSWIGANPEVDVLIVPSSYDMDPLLDDPKLISYIRHTAESAEWMASNCSGSFLLGEAGILDGKKATTWAGGEADLQDAYPKVDVQFDSNVVIDGRVITSNGSLVSYQAALMLLSKMTSRSKAEEVADTIQYNRFSDKVYF
ncbi:DJ-1/PfpI family protein [Aliamphritea spongicola]|uniref:DJ-1/PfpI family protein n=1 Tax=Aliamphritea spongicola TaxID=707589 RepID=UPI00196B68BA|nr:DJ-1/PfpI family protein [Aliamphritea spongicola]MBN3561085.1 DJ-1/PfpI family protein [Aliamphritea spongicola]